MVPASSSSIVFDRWTLASWDRTQIPKPFAHLAIAVGEPLDVPADADDTGIEAARRTLESRLRALEARAREMLAAPFPISHS